MLRLNDYRCPECGDVEEMLLHEHEQACCPMCQTVMVKMPPLVRCNMGPAGAYGYYDPNLETYVETNRHRRELCRQKGVTPKGETPKTGDAWV